MKEGLFVLPLVLLVLVGGMGAKDIYADVTCVGVGAGTSDNPYCVLSQAFADASISTGDVTVNIFGSWLVTPFSAINSPKWSSLTIQGWKGAAPSITCYAALFPPPVIAITNFAGTITIKDLTITSCPGGIKLQQIKNVILKDFLLVDSGSAKVLALSAPFETSLEVYDSAFIANSGANGGGLFTSNLTSIFVNNTNFLSNKASSNGGGAYLDSVQLEVSNCNFLGNKADSGGGALIANRAPTTGTPVSKEIFHTSFIANTGTVHGGGLYWGLSGVEGAGFSINIERCSFRQNVINVGGSGIAIDAQDAIGPFSITIQYCAIDKNGFGPFAGGAGGGLWLSGPTTNWQNAMLFLQTNRITNNGAPDAAAMVVSRMNVEIRECVVTGNFVTFGGGSSFPGGGKAIVRFTNLYTFSAIYGIQLTGSYNIDPLKLLYRSYALFIQGNSKANIFNIIDCDISYNFVANLFSATGLYVNTQTVGVYRTTLWGNYWGPAILADSNGIVYANNSVSFLDYASFPFVVSPITCLPILGARGKVYLAGGYACGCLKLDICGVCNGPGTGCLCPGNSLPSFINCTAPLVLQLPRTLSATYLPSTGTAHARLLPAFIPDGVSPDSTGVTIKYISIRDVVPNTVYPLTGMSPGRPIKTVTLDVNNIYQVDWRVPPVNNSVIVVSQEIFQDTSITTTGDVTFPVQSDTLKMTLQVTGWAAGPTDSLELELQVETNDAITEVQLNATNTILTATTSSYTSYIKTKNSVVRFSLVDFATATITNGSDYQVRATIRYGEVRNTSVQVFVSFPGPFENLVYDPDFGVLAQVDGSDGGDGGDGDTDLILVKILVPVLVGSAMIIILIGLLVGLTLGAWKTVMMYRERRRGARDMVSL